MILTSRLLLQIQLLLVPLAIELSLNGLHSLSIEQSIYDQAAMNIMRKAKSSNRETNCHCFDPKSGVAERVRVTMGEVGYLPVPPMPVAVEAAVLVELFRVDWRLGDV